jgi:hypothetical protein
LWCSESEYGLHWDPDTLEPIDRQLTDKMAAMYRAFHLDTYTPDLLSIGTSSAERDFLRRCTEEAEFWTQASQLMSKPTRAHSSDLLTFFSAVVVSGRTIPHPSSADRH